MGRFLIVFTCILNFTYFASAQNYIYEWINREKKIVEKFDLANQIFYEKKLRGEYVKKADIQVKNLVLRDIPSDNHIYLYGFNINPNKTLFTLPGTGFVFLFDRVNNLFTRIDETFYKGYNFNSVQFLQDGKLYSVGGSGFWKIHATFTRFDFKSKEWELVDTYGEVKPQRVLNNLSGYNEKLHKLYVIEPNEEYSTKTTGLYRFFEMDTKTFQWTFKGWVDIAKFTGFGITAFEVEWLGEFFYCYRRPENPVLIDPESNEILLYTGPKKLFWGFEQKNFYSNGTIYSLLPQFTRAKTVDILDSMSIKELRTHLVKDNDFYEARYFDWSMREVVIGFISALIIIALLVYFLVNVKSNRKKIVSKISTVDKSIWELLPSHGKDLLNFVQEHGCDYLFSTEEISKILDCGKKAFDTQRQYRSKFISHFNQFFEENFEIQEAISRITSEDDKRFVCYKVSEDALRQYVNR